MECKAGWVIPDSLIGEAWHWIWFRDPGFPFWWSGGFQSTTCEAMAAERGLSAQAAQDTYKRACSRSLPGASLSVLPQDNATEWIYYSHFTEADTTAQMS